LRWDSTAEVTAVATVAEAIEALQRLQPNVPGAILACGEDGYALILREPTAAEQGGQIPVVALTAYARAEDRTGYIGRLSAHVPKPVINPAESWWSPTLQDGLETHFF